MKLCLSTLWLMALVAMNTAARADESLSNQIQILQLKMTDMETQLSIMERSTDPWTLRSGIKTHASIMKDSAELIVEMSEAKRKQYEACVEGFQFQIGIVHFFRRSLDRKVDHIIPTACFECRHHAYNAQAKIP